MTSEELEKIKELHILAKNAHRDLMYVISELKILREMPASDDPLRKVVKPKAG